MTRSAVSSAIPVGWSLKMSWKSISCASMLPPFPARPSETALSPPPGPARNTRPETDALVLRLALADTEGQGTKRPKSSTPPGKAIGQKGLGADWFEVPGLAQRIGPVVGEGCDPPVR